MRHVTLVLAVLAILASTAAAGGADPAGRVRDAGDKVQGLAGELSDLVRTLIREGRIEEARETLRALDRALELRQELTKLSEKLGRGEPSAMPDLLEDAPFGPDESGIRPPLVKDVRIKRPPPPLPEPAPKPEPKESPLDRPSTNAKIGIGGGAGGAFGGRGGHRNLRAGGGGAVTENAVSRGLDWLSRHQDEKGHWDCDGFSAGCRLNRCDGNGMAPYDTGVTGLSLLAFLGAGETHKHGRYRTTVKEGLQHLKQIQDP